MFLNFSVNKNDERGEKKLSTEIIQSIQHHLESLSEISANRMVYKKVDGGKKNLVNARYMRVPYTEAYLTFPFKKEISFSSFKYHKIK